jgi:hypothetical protein
VPTRLAETHQLETDADITRLLQRICPPVNYPGARAQIVARFSERARRRRSEAWHRARRVAILTLVLGQAVAIAWICGRPWVKRLCARYRRDPKVR